MRADLPILLAAALGALLGWPRLPNAAGSDAPATGFSADRAMGRIRVWSPEPRPTGSEAHEAVVDSLDHDLTSLGFDVQRQTPGALTNLVASSPGAGPEGVWLVAHSDSVAAAPGAADDGLGLGVVLEAARALSVERPPGRLHVLITDGEERGLRGATAFVHDAPAADRLAINIDARGTEGPAYMFQMAGSTPELLSAWRASGCAAEATSLAQTVYDLLPNDTDFTVFRGAGWRGYNFALIGGAWRYHTADDTIANLAPRQRPADRRLRAWPRAGVAGQGARPARCPVRAGVRPGRRAHDRRPPLARHAPRTRAARPPAMAHCPA